jgi:hypothetical protein
LDPQGLKEHHLKGLKELQELLGLKELQVL